MTLISNELKSLPLEYVLATPMVSAIKAQAMSSKASLDFLEKIGLEKDGDEQKVRTINFSYDKLTDDGTTEKTSVSMPFLTMLQLPYLELGELSVEFDFHIKTTGYKESKDETSLSAEVKYDGWFVDVSMSGSYTNSSFSYDKTEKDANLNVKLRARQATVPQGIQTMMDMLNHSIKNRLNSESSN